MYHFRDTAKLLGSLLDVKFKWCGVNIPQRNKNRSKHWDYIVQNLIAEAIYGFDTLAYKVLIGMYFFFSLKISASQILMKSPHLKPWQDIWPCEDTRLVLVTVGMRFLRMFE